MTQIAGSKGSYSLRHYDAMRTNISAGFILTNLYRTNHGCSCREMFLNQPFQQNFREKTNEGVLGWLFYCISDCDTH